MKEGGHQPAQGHVLLGMHQLVLKVLLLAGVPNQGRVGQHPIVAAPDGGIGDAGREGDAPLAETGRDHPSDDLAPGHLLGHLLQLPEQVIRRQLGHAPAHDLGPGIPEDALCGHIPGEDLAVRRVGDDGFADVLHQPFEVAAGLEVVLVGPVQLRIECAQLLVLLLQSLLHLLELRVEAGGLHVGLEGVFQQLVRVRDLARQEVGHTHVAVSQHRRLDGGHRGARLGGRQLPHARPDVGVDEVQHLIEVLDLLVEVVLLERVADGLPGDGEEGVQHAYAAVGDGLEVGHAAEVQAPVHDPHGHGVRKVPLVVLDHERDLLDVQAIGIEVVVQVREGVHVVLHLGLAGIRHEHDSVGTPQHHPPARVVLHLAGHRVDLEVNGIAIDVAEVDGQQVEEERAVFLGVDREHLPPLRVGAHGVKGLQVGGLTAETRPVIDQFEQNLIASRIELNHVFCQEKGWAKAYHDGSQVRLASPLSTATRVLALSFGFLSRFSARDDSSDPFQDFPSGRPPGGHRLPLSPRHAMTVPTHVAIIISVGSPSLREAGHAVRSASPSPLGTR